MFRPSPRPQADNKRKSLTERLNAVHTERALAERGGNDKGERHAAKKASLEEAGERRAVVTADDDAGDDAGDAGDNPAESAVAPFLNLLNSPDFISKIKGSITPSLETLFGVVNDVDDDGRLKVSTYKKIVSGIDTIMSRFDLDDVSTPSIFMGTLRGRAKAAMDGLMDIKMKTDIENIRAARAKIVQECDAAVEKAKKKYDTSVKRLRSNRDHQILEVVAEMEEKFHKRYPVSAGARRASEGR